MARDRQVTTWLSKQIAFDHNDITNVMVAGESEYVVLCMRPDERALCLTAINFHAEFQNRWIGGWTELDRRDLLARTNESLQREMACSEDIDLLNTNLAAINTTLGEMRDRLGDSQADIDTKLADIKASIDALETTLAAIDPSLIDQLEAILNGVGVILGAPTIPLNGS